TSTNGGTNWSQPVPVAGPVTQPGVIDPNLGRPVIDGLAGARSDLTPAPSIDIANGAPDGTNATDRIVMTYVSGTLAAPHVYFTESTDHGATWSTPRAIETTGDRGYYTAPAISPNGTDVYVVYNAFPTPYQPTTARRSTLGANRSLRAEAFQRRRRSRTARRTSETATSSAAPTQTRPRRGSVTPNDRGAPRGRPST